MPRGGAWKEDFWSATRKGSRGSRRVSAHLKQMCENGTSCNILMERAPFGCLTACPARPTRPTRPTRAGRRPGGSTARERRENRGDLCIMSHLRRYFRDSGLVMCVSTLPSPLLSVPCIWGILQSPCRKSTAFSAKDHFAKVFLEEGYGSLMRLSRKWCQAASA